MNPFFFGTREKQLYGVHHAPRAMTRDVAVLLCNAGPQEYMATHWAMRRLANLLTQRGHHVLRFDYLGTGDSAGNQNGLTLDTWRENIVLSSRELRDLSGASRVHVVGLRLGAALAAQATTCGLDVEDLVLWEPVVRGPDYVNELRVLALRKFARLLYYDGARDDELAGEPFPPAMAEETAMLDLFGGVPRARRVLVFSSREKPLHRELVSHINARGGRAEHATLAETGDNDARVDGAMLSSSVVHAIAESLARP